VFAIDSKFHKKPKISAGYFQFIQNTKQREGYRCIQ
jgi:hypothetical protein